MSIDMSQFHATFFEEGHEHLDEMERVLMAIDLSAPQAEDLDTIFRAAHSIKGGSGIFGFDALTTVTHVMENILEQVRSGSMSLTQPLVDCLLGTSDHLRAILESYRNQSEINWTEIGDITHSLEVWLTAEGPAPQVEQGYGFFEPLQQPGRDDSYGFFDQDESEQAGSDDGFGFFEPLPATAELPEVPVAGAAPTDVAATSSPAQPVVRPDSSQPAQRSEREASSIRVDIVKVDQLVNMVGELVITQSMLNLIGSEVQGPETERLHAALVELERNTRELQESIMSIRMLPISFVFNRFPRVVRDLSSKLHKRVELVVEGGQTEIDKGLIERLADPLTHLVRNSLDHGIEQPEERLRKGKPECGRLTLRAEQKGGNILISVIDDGAGLNRERILQKAAEKSIELPEHPTDSQVWQLIMAPGFSTAAEVTDVSGRGVGMDVVKRNIEHMGGRIEIESRTGEGAKFQIRLPLTLAILDGMSVAVGEQHFIIPLVNIIESVQPSPEQIKQIKKQEMLELRDAYWPIVPLYQVMQVEGARTAISEAILVLIETSKTRFALMVDDLIGQQQVVIKSLEQHYRRVPGIAGATIMGDGSVALILDAESLAQRVDESLMMKEAV